MIARATAPVGSAAHSARRCLRGWALIARGTTAWPASTEALRLPATSAVNVLRRIEPRSTGKCRPPALEFSAQPPFGKPPVEEEFAVEVEPGREVQTGGLSKRPALFCVHIESGERQRIFGAETLENLLRVITERTVILGEEKDLHG